MYGADRPLTWLEKLSFIHWAFAGRAELRQKIRVLQEENRKALRAVAAEMIKVQELEREVATLKAKGTK